MGACGPRWVIRHQFSIALSAPVIVSQLHFSTFVDLHWGHSIGPSKVGDIEHPARRLDPARTAGIPGMFASPMFGFQKSFVKNPYRRPTERLGGPARREEP